LYSRFEPAIFKSIRKELNMPFCPKCGCEYQRGVELCSDDGERLVEELPFDPATAPDPSGNMVMVYSTTAQVEAGMIEEMLESEGIVVGMSNQVGSLMLQYAPPLAGIRLFVHERDEAHARELIEIFLKTDAPGETEVAAEPEAEAPPATAPTNASPTGLLFWTTLWAWIYLGLGVTALFLFPWTFEKIVFNLESPIILAFNLTSSIVTIGSVLYFFIHIKRNPRLSGVQKGLWALGIFYLSVIVLPVYFFREIWIDQPKVAPPEKSR
jgi:hypothetical protein